MQIRIGDLELEAKLPDSFALRDDLVSGALDNWRRASYASLGLCCEGLKLTVSYRGCNYNPLIYGGRVFDELVARGMDRHEIMSAAIVVWSMISESFISEDEVAEEEAFLEVAGAGSIG
jgi:hypothetical protein